MDKLIQASRILDNITPLDTDCGLLCGKACCSGKDNRGMLLFPGEAEIFSRSNKTWLTVTDSEITLESGENIKLLTCNGDCPREMRPIACRIFPLIPYINDENILEIRPDIRSASICPIFSNPEKYIIQEEFIDTLYDAFEILLEDENILEFIEILSEDYDNMAGLILE